MQKNYLTDAACFGVAGNFTGHLEQAGEAENFKALKIADAAAPKALFPTYVPPIKNPENANLEEGKKLLDEAGIVDANNDGLRDFNGNTFKLSISINNDSMLYKIVGYLRL